MSGIYNATMAKNALKNFQYPKGQSNKVYSKSINTNNNGSNFNASNLLLSAIPIVTGMLNNAYNDSFGDMTYQEQLNRDAIYGRGDDPIIDLFSISSDQKEALNNIQNSSNKVFSGAVSSNQAILDNYNNIDFDLYKPAEKITFGQGLIKNLSAFGKGASYGAVAGPWGALIGGIAGGLADLGSYIGSGKRRKQLNLAAANAKQNSLYNFNQLVSNSNRQNNYVNMANNNGLALGGALDIMSNNQYNLNNYITAMNRNRMTSLPNSFQKTAFSSLNQFSLGGDVKYNEFNAGGTHEENPNGGVLQGFDSQGIPNTVEEGEVKVNTPNGEYVFSNRLKLSKEECKKLKIPEGSTYAEAAKILRKDYDERPNDTISKKGWEQFQNMLIESQELQKQEMAIKEAEIQGNSNEDIADIDSQLAQQLAAEQIIAQQNPNVSGVAPKIAQQLTNEQQYNVEQDLPIDNNRFDFGGFINKYAPLGIDLVGLATNLTTPVDKTAASAYQQAIDDIQYYEPKLNYNYAQYKPVDINQAMNNYWNNVNSQINAVRNTTNPSSNAALQALAYTANTGAGKRYDELAQQNYNRYRDVLDFNNRIDANNASLIAQAAQINADKDKQKASLLGAKIADINAKTASKQTAIGKSLGNISDMFRSMWMEEEDKKIAILNALSKGVNYTPEMGILIEQLIPGFLTLVKDLQGNNNGDKEQKDDKGQG